MSSKRLRTYSCPPSSKYVPNTKKQLDLRDEETRQDAGMMAFAIKQRKEKENPKVILPEEPLEQKVANMLSLDLSSITGKHESIESKEIREQSLSARDILKKRQKNALRPLVTREKERRSALSART